MKIYLFIFPYNRSSNLYADSDSFANYIVKEAGAKAQKRSCVERRRPIFLFPEVKSDAIRQLGQKQNRFMAVKHLSHPFLIHRFRNTIDLIGPHPYVPKFAATSRLDTSLN